MSEIRLSATLPPGKYVIGDPCYAIPNDNWHDWLDAAGCFDSLGRDHVLFAEVDGRPCVGVSTAYGDGMYRGSDGNEYPVDAGLIGLVPVGLVDFTERFSDHIVADFPDGAECFYDDGIIHLGEVIIDTRDEDDDGYCSHCGRG